ncbi:MAG: polyprenyl synthetase family protein [Anaerolineales bacterium]|nr:polyprenyl synthetase family protein [Anaerolineales bacterium]MCB9127318.1 polyprenyl synthetase family protein [Ardenticatenales bacterium]
MDDPFASTLFDAWLPLWRAATWPSIAMLPQVVCEAAGGDPQRVTAASAAWQHLYLAAKYFDDIQDEGCRPCRPEVSIGLGLLFKAQNLLTTYYPELRAADVTLELPRILWEASRGQYADWEMSAATTSVATAERWLAQAHAKSGTLLGWSAGFGSVLANVSPEQAAAYQYFGERLGILIQVADDFKDMWSVNGAKPLNVAMSSLPLCFARTVISEREWAQLQLILESVAQGNEEALVELRQQLTDWGAPAYVAVIAKIHRQQACDALAEADCPQPDLLKRLLDQIFPLSEIEGLSGEAFL